VIVAGTRPDSTGRNSSASAKSSSARSIKTKALLKRELEIKLGELEQQWHWDSLERIFIEERIYRRIEKSKTWESVLEEIREGLKPFLRQLRREVTDDDITRLTEIRIKRISAYNRFQADEAIKKIEAGIKETRASLKNLTPTQSRGSSCCRKSTARD
jgi:topoisomerase-4 subunit A